jgi:hypothetical protein
MTFWFENCNSQMERRYNLKKFPSVIFFWDNLPYNKSSELIEDKAKEVMPLFIFTLIVEHVVM